MKFDETKPVSEMKICDLHFKSHWLSPNKVPSQYHQNTGISIMHVQSN